MNVCFVANDKYLDYLVVCLQSFFVNNIGNHNIYILCNDMMSEHNIIINNLCSQNNSKLFVINVEEEKLHEFPILRDDFNLVPYYKLFIPIYIPKNVKRILYLDVDTIVDKNITTLYNVDLKSKVLAAVPDPLINVRDVDYVKRLKIDKNEKYFNSGVVLFNLDELRKHYSLKEILEYIDRNKSNFKFHDQEVLNALYHSRYYELNEKYNYLSTYRSILDMLFYKHDINKQICIYHFANKSKPWSKNYIGKFHNKFWEYCKQTDVYEKLKQNEKTNIFSQIELLNDVINRKIKNIINKR